MVVEGTPNQPLGVLDITRNTAATGLSSSTTYSAIRFGATTVAGGDILAQIYAKVDGSTTTTGSKPTNLVFATTASGDVSTTERFYISEKGSLQFKATTDGTKLELAQPKDLGYSPSYKGVILGNTATGFFSSVSIGYDFSQNNSGSFQGDGRELFLRNNHRIVTPNAANNAFLPNITFNQGAHGTIGVNSGILFGSDTASANTLDDYEEGTWTPVINRTGTSPTVTYNDRVGTYVKIGKFCIVFWDISIATISGGTGSASISSLPFTVSSNMAGYSVILNRDNSAMVAGPAGTQLKGFFEQGNSYMFFQYDNSGVNGFGTSLTATNWTTNRSTGCGFYEV